VPEAELAAEQVQQNQHHDNQQDDGKDSTASAAASFDYGRPLALGIVAIIGHGLLSLFTFPWRNERIDCEAVPRRGKLMKSQCFLGSVGLIALTSCGPERQPQPPVTNKSSPVLPAPSAPPAVANSEAPAVPPPGTGPDARTPLAEPKGAIDPKSGQGARAVAQQFCEMLKGRHYDAAHRLWSGDASTDAEFARHWAGYGKLEGCAIDEAGQLEGAAGSIYTSVPAEFFFKGGLVKLSGSLTLRRVNDVPGSTEEQRRWHIVKSDFEAVD
jgi:hypothetical protein